MFCPHALRSSNPDGLHIYETASFLASPAGIIAVEPSAKDPLGAELTEGFFFYLSYGFLHNAFMSESFAQPIT